MKVSKINDAHLTTKIQQSPHFIYLYYLNTGLDPRWDDTCTNVLGLNSALAIHQRQNS